MPETHTISSPEPRRSALSGQDKKARLGSPAQPMAIDSEGHASQQDQFHHEASLDDDIFPRVRFPPAEVGNPEAPITIRAMNTLFREYLAPVMQVSRALGYDCKEFKQTMETNMEE